LGIAADFVLIIVAGLIGGFLARLLRLPLLVGYVAAGVVVGPNTGGPTVGEIEQIELLAEIGVALLLFSLGLEISLRDLGPVRGVALLGSPIQILLVMGGTVLALTLGLGWNTTEATWLGAMFALSSTMVVLTTLSEGGVAATLASRVMIGILVVQDLAVIPMLIVLPQLGAAEGLAAKLLQSLAAAAVTLAAIVLIGTRLLPHVLKWVLLWGGRELFLVGVVATGVGIGYAAHAAGLSFALGAFVAGMVLSESEFSHQALSDVTPLRDVFGLLFFVTAGMLFDPRFVIANWPLVLATVASVLLGKALIVGVSTRLFGYANHAPWIVGMGLAQIGEFSFVLARAGLNGGFLSGTAYNLALTVTVLTMAISPLYSSFALPLARRWRTMRGNIAPAANIEHSAVQLAGHAIIAGFGRTGTAAAKALRAAGVPLLVIESSHPLFRDAAAAGFSALWGDITRPELLHAAGLERARLLLLAMPDADTVTLALDAARTLNPNVAIVARAARETDVLNLRGRNVAVVMTEFEGGVEMVRRAFGELGVDPEARLEHLDAVRAELYGRA
jgi:monovalent cation:H+ antiporter-2, CPA2 family